MFELGDPERDNFDEHSLDGSRKLSALKETIRRSKLPLRDGYSSLEQFGEMVLKDLQRAISIDFPETEEAAKLKRSSLDFNVVQNESFYFERLEYEREIQHYIDHGLISNKGKKSKKKIANSSLLIQSDEGSGKTTLLASIASKYQANDKV